MAVIKQIQDTSGTIHDIIDTNTLNTAGATQTADKIFVVGATEQTDNPVTYTNQKCYIGTDNCLYSNGVKVSTTDTKNTAGSTQLDSTKLYIVGASRQASSTATNTTQKCYIGTDSCLYSNNIKVATIADLTPDTKNTAGATSVPTSDGKAPFYLVGTKDSGVASAQTYVNNSVYVDVINGNILYVPNIRSSGNILCDGMINASNFQTTGGISCNYFTSGEIVADRILNKISIVDEATNTPIITLGEENDDGEYVGNITTTNGIITASAFYESSDERLKTFTEEYDINLDDIKNIKTGRFYWNSDENKVINGGVTAQSVEKYFPELVREDKNGTKIVNYDGLAGVALAAIKKLTERIEELENIVYNK